MGAGESGHRPLIETEPFQHPTQGDLLLVPGLNTLGERACAGCIFDDDHPNCVLTACTRSQIAARTLDEYIEMRVTFKLTGRLP